jgi:DNA-directed RNA polymerase specialized sigma24 family protein
VLRFYEDMTERQTAAALGCHVGTVKKYTARALDTLRGDARITGPVSRKELRS